MDYKAVKDILVYQNRYITHFELYDARRYDLVFHRGITTYEFGRVRRMSTKLLYLYQTTRASKSQKYTKSITTMIAFRGCMTELLRTPLREMVEYEWLTTERNGAGDETRTRDIFLGKEVLYQLSYARASII
jgi:hypothetical protein